MRSALLGTLAVMIFGACGGAEGGGGGGGGTAGALEHTFPAISAEPGQEVAWVCQSWSLENDEPLYVTTVGQENDGGWHHSNWFFVTDDTYGGPDGTWPCGERDFSEIDAGLSGGVLFAQSTQSLTDEQAFAEGQAIRLPPRSRIVGNVHILNTTAKAIDTAITLRLDTVPKDEVATELYPVSLTNIALDLEPNAESRFSMDCDLGPGFRQRFDREPDFNIVYVLPHYHALGNYFLLAAVDDEGGTETIFETTAGVGDPVGKTLAPPFPMAGSSVLRLTCGYDNPRSERVVYGIGDQEMCVVLAYIDAPLKVAGTGVQNVPLGQDESGVYLNEAGCGAVAF